MSDSFVSMYSCSYQTVWYNLSILSILYCLLSVRVDQEGSRSRKSGTIGSHMH